MNLKPEDLKKNDYYLLDRLDHKELIPFVRKYLKKITPFSVIYYLSNIACLGLILFFSLKFYGEANFTIGNALTYFSNGLAIAFALIPIHEYIHVLAYKSQGAKQTSYDVHIKKFYFLAIADKFVATKREFQIVALSPFIFISLTLVILLFFTGPLWTFTILGILITHTACCSGDFALLSYFDLNKDKVVVTYDDKENKVSYFYGKIK